MPRLRRLLPPRPPPGLLLARVQAGGLAGSAPAGSSRTGPRLPPPRQHRLPVRRVRHPLPWRAVVRRLRASLPRPRTRRLVRTLWRLAHPGRASRRGGPNVIAASDDRPPTANRSWLGISLIDSLKESDTPHSPVSPLGHLRVGTGWIGFGRPPRISLGWRCVEHGHGHVGESPSPPSCQ